MLIATLLSCPARAQYQSTAHIRPIDGSRMIIGDGEIEDFSLQCFLHLCRSETPSIAVIQTEEKTRISEKRLKALGASSVHMISSLPTDAQTLASQLLDKDGIWIESTTDNFEEHELLLPLLTNIAHRNGVDQTTIWRLLARQ